MLDESGHKQYAGSNNLQSADPAFLDVTDLTHISQFRISPANVITFEKSPDNGHFLVTANSINGASLIELLSPESSQVIVSARVSVEPDADSLYVIDLIVRCVDALSISRQNRTDDAGKFANEFETVTVSLSMNANSLPCYLLVFLVFSDHSIERVSSFDPSHYQMLLVTVDSQPISKMMISDGQLVTVKWTKNNNISILGSTACIKPNIIFSKQIHWDDLVPVANQFPATHVPFIVNSQTPINQTNLLIGGYESSNKILHLVIYIFIALLALCFLCLILHRIFCSKRRLHRHQNTAATCYNISDSGFLSDHNKVVIKNSNSKTFSSLGKCSGNFFRANNNNKCHYSEPYPPLLPPPGPISTNYDLSINDTACCDSAVDSGIELGKLSSYSSNTNPSNDICCSVADDNLYRPSAQFGAPLFGAYHSHKDIMESIHGSNDKPRTVVNLRSTQW